MNFLSLVPSSVLYAIIVALALAGGKLFWDNSHLEVAVATGKTELANCDRRHSEAVAMAEQHLRAQEQDFRNREHALQIAMDEQRRIKDEQIANSDAVAAALKLRLAKTRITITYPAPPASAAGGPGPDPGTATPAVADNATIVSPEATRLVDEARRADLIRVNLLNCYDSYDRARAALMEVSR